jgi:methionyl-tRNA synthetase
MSTYDFEAAFKAFDKILYLGNQYLSESKFWAVSDEGQLDTILYTTVEVIRVSTIILQPFCPDLTAKILSFLSVEESKRGFKNAKIDETSMQRSIVFDVEKKNEIFIQKYEPLSPEEQVVPKNRTKK